MREQQMQGGEEGISSFWSIVALLPFLLVLLGDGPSFRPTCTPSGPSSSSSSQRAGMMVCQRICPIKQFLTGGQVAGEEFSGD